METVNVKDAGQISEALVIWVGPVPTLGYDREAALIDRFGAELAAQLVPIVRALEDEFFRTNAGALATELHEMHKLAFDDFKRKHPEISDPAVYALTGKYTYENR